MNVKIELHANAADLAGERIAGIDLASPATAGDVKAALARRYPALEGLLPSCVLATDTDYLPDRGAVPEGEIFHLIPPVSGG